MLGSYNLLLVALSLGVATLASYTLLEVAARVRGMAADGTRRRMWVLGGAVAMGNGIWSMHFIGMLARQMPMPMRYDPWMTGGSLLLAIGIAALALHLMTTGGKSHLRLALGGLVIGIGIVGMHTAGMSAMLVRRAILYRPGRVALSVVIALVAAWASLAIDYALRQGDPGTVRLRRAAAATVMGVAIAGMHYVGMSAMILVPGMVALPRGMGDDVLVALVPVLALSGLGITLGISRMDERFERLMESTAERLGNAARLRESGLELDHLYGCVTRASLLERIDSAIVDAEREGTCLGIMFLDLDGFKTVNDSLGFAAGDELLRSFFEDLRRRVRPETTVARLSGDEFLVVLNGFKDLHEVAATARSIFERLERDFHVQGLPLRVTASAGVAAYALKGETAAELLKSANLALHSAKRDGKNSLRFFEPAMSDSADKMLQINRSLGVALEQRQFSLMFQPKFDGRKNRITGAEALIRWKHPDLGNIPPMDFIPVAEETGQILQISEWVIQEVCRQLNEWKTMGLPPLRIAINLSPEQLREDHYAEHVADLVAEAGIDPRSIMFEITETAAMREPKRAREVIEEFQRAGFDFAIDDFGTGYSSLAYLQQFRVSELKIDRSFINAIRAEDAESAMIVSAIIGLAHALRMTVVAEGVETAEQLKQLNAMFCDEVQGYLLARPLTPHDFEDRVLAEVQAAEGREPVATAVLRSAMA